jgi:hypothetical protein
VAIRFGQPPTPVPEPFATLLQATAQRDNLQTATNPGARWLFPGRRGGQPLHASHLAALVRDLGVPALAGRTAALRQLVLQAPAPVVAQALGYHHSTTTRVATEAGTPWSCYALGDTAAAINRSDHQGCPFSSDLGCGGVADLRGSDRVRSRGSDRVRSQ